MTISPDWLAKLESQGATSRGVRVEALGDGNDEPNGKPILVAPSFAPPATWVVPVEVPSLANSRDWKVRNRVSQAHRKAVTRAVARQIAALVPFVFALHHGTGGVRCRLTRLGGRKLDRTANLPASLKYCEDAVCLMLGIDDGDGRWRCECEQEPGGPTGVRIELEMA